MPIRSTIEIQQSIYQMTLQWKSSVARTLHTKFSFTPLDIEILFREKSRREWSLGNNIIYHVSDFRGLTKNKKSKKKYIGCRYTQVSFLMCLFCQNAFLEIKYKIRLMDVVRGRNSFFFFASTKWVMVFSFLLFSFSFLFKKRGACWKWGHTFTKMKVKSRRN